ncbi:MAG TPA: GNAT family N-acetyltransferase [Candidatus Sulfopaludibacter sp.]|nr:GNAT family N-acetyltransferase [Candidatus Sulfopaludibacter sp.]
MPAQMNIALQGFFLRSGGTISAVGKVLQRKSTVQLRPGTDAFPVDLRPKSGGWPLPRDVQRKMEHALGANFSDVRIHVGPEASSIGAIAFTWGSDIHFAPGQYNPHTPHGQFLLGHELTHVVQQRAGRVANPFGSGVAVVQDHALEAEADRLGKAAARIVLPAEDSGGTRNAAQPAMPRPCVIHQKPATIHQKPAAPPQYTVRPARRDGDGWEIDAAVAGRPDAAGRVRLTPSENGVYISDLSVHPEHRRHGLARQLVQAAMRTARSQGFSVAQLEARPSPGADMNPISLVSMYQKLGFRTTGRSHRGSPLMERRT